MFYLFLVYFRRCQQFRLNVVNEGRLVNSKLKRVWKEPVVAHLKKV